MEMTKPKLAIDFHGFWDKDEVIFPHYFTPSHSFLFSKYNVVLDKNNPDILFCSLWGNPPENVKCPTVALVHENYTPTEEFCSKYDYVISFTKDGPKNNIRIPYWVYHLYDLYHFSGWDNFAGFFTNTYVPGDPFVDDPFNRKNFCAYLHSKKDNYRERVVEHLSTYRKVDKGNPRNSNLTDPDEIAMMNKKVEGQEGFMQKIDFFANRKFSFAMENSWSPGYVTEKILDSHWASTIPLYCGILDPSDGFNEKAFVNMYHYDTMAPFVEKVKYLDQNKGAYDEMLSEPLFTKFPDNFYIDSMIEIYDNMIIKKKDPQQLIFV